MRLIIASTLLLAACAAYPNEILEKRDTQFLKVNLVEEEGACRISLSGLAFKSAMAVERSEQKKIGESELNILIHLVPAREGMSGRFSESFLVAPDIKFVTLGSSRSSIWERSKGCVQ